MPPTGLVQHPSAVRHDTGRGHPERADRVLAIARRLEASGLLAEIDPLEARAATAADLVRVHDPEHVRSVEERIRAGVGILDGGDTTVSAGSWEAALHAAGAALDAVDRVMDGTWSNAFAICRPPGHHAERTHAMGFCLFNNAAVAAAHLCAERGCERVAIVDWDVHHGNGTQHIFEADGSVFYASLHQYPHYPGTGAAAERGTGAGAGATLNCPLAAGTGDAEWLDAFESRVLPALEDFRPEFVIVSAGFDAHQRDPLSGTRVTEEGYRRMSEGLCQLAQRTAGGRLVGLLEGGYDLDATAASVECHLTALRAAAESA